MKKWYNNGEKCSYFEEGTQPQGWVLGRIKWKQNNFEKLKQELLNKYSIDEIFNYYCTHTKLQTCQKFNIKQHFLVELLKFFNLKKTQKQINETREKTNLQLFGETNPFKNEEIKQKIKEQNLEKYGVGNPAQREDIKERLKEIAQSRDYTERTRKTKQTLLGRYGDKNYVNVEKCKQTKLEKHGDPGYNNIQKIKSTCIERYGKQYYAQTEEFKTFLKKHSQEKWGTNSFLSTKEFKSKSNKTMLERYGITSYTQTEQYRQKIKKLREQKLQQEQVTKDFQQEYTQQLRDVLYNKENSIQLLKRLNYPTRYDLMHYFQCSYGVVQTWINRLNLNEYVKSESTNHYERELLEQLKEFEFKLHQRVLNGKEIDLYSEKFKVGIEFNGNYWHSNLHKDKKYHEEKSKLAQSMGIRLIHIYEYEWNDGRVRPILLSLISIACGKVPSKIYARNCEIREITNKEAKPFNNKNHLQGHRNAQITYGLFYHNKLVQLMSFSKHKKYGWEIIRGCPGSNNIVIGGVGKLFKHFLDEINPEQVFSYCDFNKFDGRSYEAIGMRFISYTGPDKTWIINGQAVKRNAAKYKQYKETAEAIIWGAGSKKYLWQKQNLIKE